MISQNNDHFVIEQNEVFCHIRKFGDFIQRGYFSVMKKLYYTDIWL